MKRGSERFQGPKVEHASVKELITVQDISPLRTITLPRIGARAAFFSTKGTAKKNMLDMLSIYTIPDGVFITLADGHRGRHAAETSITHFPSLFASAYAHTLDELEAFKAAFPALHHKIIETRNNQSVDGAAVGAVYIKKDSHANLHAFGITPSDVVEEITDPRGLWNLLGQPKVSIAGRSDADQKVNVVNPIGDEDQVRNYPYVSSPDFGDAPLYPGDILIMHSDGLTSSTKAAVKTIIDNRFFIQQILTHAPELSSQANGHRRFSAKSISKQIDVTGRILDLVEGTDYQAYLSDPLLLAMFVSEQYIKNLHEGKNSTQKGLADDVFLFALEIK